MTSVFMRRATVRNLNWFAATTRGLSQIFFQANVWTGLAVLAGFAIANWRMALLAVIGLLCSTLSGVLLRRRLGELGDGLHGYCGALVGAAQFSALGFTWPAAAFAVAGGLACGPVTVALAWLFYHPSSRKYSLPVTTAPFCIVAGVLFAVHAPLHGPHTDLGEVPENILANVGQAILNNISEVVLVDSSIAGAVILVGLFIAHWKVGAAALLGSGMEALMDLATGSDVQAVAHGLLGYSGVLTAIALAVVFVRGTWQPWIAAVVGVVVSSVLAWLMGLTALPVYTWPFILATWLMLVVLHHLPGFSYHT
ncbi:urea transporter [Pseudarthrobacter sulfonivorans]|uniref:urea transporter n=1 Tax=Pseudarthrobacter sulfonivorans TaxID=121292 RepID=UPI00210396B4|nr:urea transporter [Pseudarthrobacter sulfonivorans]